MSKRNAWLLLMTVLMAVFVFLSCQSYRQKVTPIKLPAAYPNVTTVADTQIAAQAYNNETFMTVSDTKQHENN